MVDCSDRMHGSACDLAGNSSMAACQDNKMTTRYVTTYQDDHMSRRNVKVTRGDDDNLMTRFQDDNITTYVIT